MACNSCKQSYISRGSCTHKDQGTLTEHSYVVMKQSSIAADFYFFAFSNLLVHYYMVTSMKHKYVVCKFQSCCYVILIYCACALEL